MGKTIAWSISVTVLLLFTLAGVIGTVGWRNSSVLLYANNTVTLTPVIFKGDLLVVRERQIALPGDYIGFTNPGDSHHITVRRAASSNDGAGAVKVIKVIPLAGYALNALKRPGGLALMVYSPAFFVIRSETRRLIRKLMPEPYIFNNSSVAVSSSRL